jgi:Flp pilus assembly protein TadD
LSPAENEQISEHPIENIKAYECYLKARYEIWTFTKEGVERAIIHLSNGLKILGENTLLLRGLGFSRFMQLNIGVSSDRTLITEIENYAGQIFKWNPESPHGFFLQGCAAVLKGDFIEAVKKWRQAYKFDPNDPDTLGLLGAHSLSTGQPEFTRKLADKLVTIDPLVPIYHILISYSDFYRGKPGDNLESLRKAVKMGPDDPIGMNCAVRIFAAAGEMEEAFSVAKELNKRQPNTMFSQAANALMYAIQGKKEEALNQITTELLELVHHDCEWATTLIESYAIIGEKEKALDLLEHSISGGLINYPFLNEYDPFLENIRSESRFKKLMERVKHEWESFEV